RPCCPVPGSDYSGFVARIDGYDGTLEWAVPIGGGQTVTIKSVREDPVSGDLLIVGDFATFGAPAQVTFPGGPPLPYAEDNAFLVRFDTDGVATALTPIDGSTVRVNDVEVAPDRTVYVFGNYESDATFGPGTPNEIDLDSGKAYFDAFVAAYRPGLT